MRAVPLPRYSKRAKEPRPEDAAKVRKILEQWPQKIDVIPPPTLLELVGIFLGEKVLRLHVSTLTRSIYIEAPKKKRGK